MKKRKPKAPFVIHSEETLLAAIRAAIPVGGAFWDWLTLERLAENHGQNEYERGVVEGARRFAARLMDMVDDDNKGV